MKKNKVGAILLILSLVVLFFSGSINLTGNVISENSKFYFNPIYVIALMLFINSMFMFASRQSLDAIIIPTGSHEQDIKRARKAIERKNELRDSGYFLISGYVPKGEKDKRVYKGSQTQDIYKELRKHGIKPFEMRIEPRARNTIENILYSLQKVKERGGRDVGIVSYPGHLDRFEYIIKRGKKEGIIDENFNIHRIPTGHKETPIEIIYELLSGILNRYKLIHGVEEALNSEDDPLVKFLKKSKDFVVNLIPGKNK